MKSTDSGQHNKNLVNLQTTRFKKPALTSGSKSTGLENLLSTRAFFNNLLNGSLFENSFMQIRDMDEFFTEKMVTKNLDV
jgi:hypothetical protein